MSSAIPSIMIRASYPLSLSETLSESNQHLIVELLNLLPADNIAPNDNKDFSQSAIIIKDMVDGRGLACPMPLLKTKVALRNLSVGESLYIVATDPNSQADITAFCQQSRQTETTNPLLLVINQATVLEDSLPVDSQLKYSADTIYHFIITKTDSN